jgi:hypothetical protein
VPGGAINIHDPPEMVYTMLGGTSLIIRVFCVTLDTFIRVMGEPSGPVPDSIPPEYDEYVMG